MKRDSEVDGGSGKGRREKTPTPKDALKAVRPRRSAPAKREAKITQRTRGQGALDHLQIDLPNQRRKMALAAGEPDIWRDLS